jgi:TRAP-type transport system periplasmic protein
LPEHQEIILQTGKELASFHTDLVREEETAQWQEIEAAGMAVNDVEREPFVEATAPVIEKYADVFGAELIESIRETR